MTGEISVILSVKFQSYMMRRAAEMRRARHREENAAKEQVPLLLPWPAGPCVRRQAGGAGAAGH